MRVKKTFLTSMMLFFLISGSLLYAVDRPPLLLPERNNQCVPVETLFAWMQELDASHYNLQIAANEAFTNIMLEYSDIPITNREVVLPYYNSVFYWRVEVVYTDNARDTSEVWSFRTKSREPNQILPLDSNFCVSMKVRFSWEALDLASSYRLQVAMTDDFDSTIWDVYPTYNYSELQMPFYNTEYFWRVRSEINANCATEWSEVRLYKTSKFPPAHVAPEDGLSALYPQGIKLDWSSYFIPDSFALQVSSNANFSDTLLFVDGLMVSEYTLPNLDYNKRYYWRVRSYFWGCETDWTDAWSFRTRFNVTTLKSPATNEECVPLNNTFVWNKLPNVLNYTIMVSTDPEFIADTTIFRNVLDTMLLQKLPEGLTTYYWTVRAEDDTNVGDWSNVFNLTTASAPADLLSPVRGSSGHLLNVQLRWNSISEAATHRVQLSTDSLFAEDFILIDTVLYAHELNVELENYFTYYYWRVLVIYEDCSSGWSDFSYFRTLIQAPTLVRPANNSTRQPLNLMFEWLGYEYVDYYDIQVSIDSSFSSSSIIRSLTNIQTMMVFIPGFPPETELLWRVRAVNPEGMSDWSEIFTFTTISQGAEVPVLLSPSNGTQRTPLELTFVWKESVRADGYNVQLATDYEFNDLVIDVNNVVDTTLDVEDLEYYKYYYWRVRAVNDSGATAWSSIWLFRTMAQLPTDPALLITPSENSVDQDVIIRFIWGEVPRAERYHLQVSLDNTFEEPVVNDSIIFQVSKLISNLDYDTEYFWRVGSRNESGIGPWSDIWKFKTKIYSTVDESMLKDYSIVLMPNPVRDIAQLQFSLENPENVSIILYDMTGRIVANIANSQFSAGAHSVNIDTKLLYTGAYIYEIQIGLRRYASQLLIIK